MENFTILYVEDDPKTQELMKMVLEDEVKAFYQAFDGEEGLRLTKEHKPDIILTDITMPHLDGLSMSKIIKEENPQQLIFVLSAFEDRKLLKGAVSLGIKYFMPKPIDVDSLLFKLNKIAQSLDH